MSNKLTDLNTHLFTQLERINKSDLKGDELKEEINRGRAITQIGKQIISNANLALQAEKTRLDWGEKANLPEYIQSEKSLEHKK